MIPCLVVILAVGFLPATAMTRSVLIGIPLSGAVTLVTASLGAIIGTSLGSSIVLPTFVIATLADGLALWSLVRDHRGARPGALDPGSVVGDLVTTAVVLVPALLLFLLFPPPPLGWDARSIWWFHASWFAAGGEVTRHLIADPTVLFSHVNYPPGTSASIATVWRVAGGRNLAVAEVTTSALTAFAVSTLVVVLLRNTRSTQALLAGALLVAGASGLGAGLATSGYVDLLGAGLLVASLVAFLTIEDPRLRLTTGGLCLAASTLVKTEDFIFAFAVIVLAVVLSRDRRWLVAGAATFALVPVVLWELVVSSLNSHASTDIGPGDFLSVLGHTDRARVHVAVSSVFGGVYPLLLATTAAFALLAAAQWRSGPPGSLRRSVELRAACGLLVAAYCSAAIDALVYVAGKPPLQWWLDTSLERVVTAPRLFALAAAVLLLPVASRLVRGPQEGSPPDAPEVGRVAVTAASAPGS